jgi:hypothetical protein
MVQKTGQRYTGNLIFTRKSIQDRIGVEGAADGVAGDGAQENGVEHLCALYRPDRFTLEMTLNRVGTKERRHWQPAIRAAE